MAVNASRVWATNPRGNSAAAKVCSESTARVAKSPLPGKRVTANTPIATNTSSLTSDSSAIASIMPW